MNKRSFWLVMCALSMGNGALFYRLSRDAMESGIASVDNQASLLFIPVLWIIAAAVLVCLNVYTLVFGRRIPKSRRIHFLEAFRFSGRRPREAAGQIGFLAITCLLMAFAYLLFTPGRMGAAYALSGGALLICLSRWQEEGEQAYRG